MNPGLWYVERFEDLSMLGLRAHAHLPCERSELQSIEVIDTPWLGRVLVLDGIFQTCERFEHVYHEMIVHPALCSAPSIERVLVIGGGDGGTAREVLRHPGVERCVMVEIDEGVVRACKEHLPSIGRGVWEDPRLDLRFDDGVRFVKETDERFDVVILDGSDPIGPSKGLFDRSFYEGVRQVLSDDGLFALQSESPTADEGVFYEIQWTAREIFGRARPCFASVVLYGVGMWTWTLAGTPDPRALVPGRVEAIAEGCRHYSAELHAASFVAPAEIARRLAEGPGHATS